MSFHLCQEKKTNTISVCTNTAVVVIGEYYKTSIQVAPSYIGKIIVSVMNRETQEWSIADSSIIIVAKFPNQTTGTADKFAFRDRENC